MAFVLLAGATLSTRPASAQNGPPPQVRRAIDGVVQMLEGGDEASLATFVDQYLARSYRDSFAADGKDGRAALLAHLRALREAARGSSGTVRVEREDSGDLLVQLEGERAFAVRLRLDEAFAIARLEAAGAPADAPAAPVLTWDGLAETFRRAEADGLSGVVVAVRDGKEVLRAAYGQADRASGRRTAVDTVYCIGSTPIDFTVAAVRLLGQRGQLRLDDTIDRYLPAVPADKKTMTLRHLMSGASGLPNFHHDRAKDWDADLAWVDRDAAVARILAQPLLFAPGKGDAHSHSAFGLLAAVVEKVSGKSYPDFLRSEIFAPLGMTRTGFYGETLGLVMGDFASGEGERSVGLPNIPPNWGPTSWLVMGSGGMFSTLADLQRFYDGVDGGRLLTGEWLRVGPTIDVGGSERGFYVFHVSNGKGSRVLLLTNGSGMRPQVRALQRGLERLVLPGAPRA